MNRESAARGRLLLRERIDVAPDCLAALPETLASLAPFAQEPVRALVATGIGTSEGHARHLVEVAARDLGWPARFVPTAALTAPPPASAAADWLIVFSQGLSPNALHAFAHAECWGRVVLVTAADAQAEGEDRLGDEKRAALAALEARGVIRIDLGCGLEYGTLLRVIGSRAGYGAAWALLRTLARGRLEEKGSLDVEPDALAQAQRAAAAQADALFPATAPIAPFFASDRTLLLVSEGGVLDYVSQLPLKIAEGMLRPAPQAVDVLEFAHGPLQSIARRQATILYLAGPDDSAGWLERFRATLDPTLHALRVVRRTLPFPFAAVEFEAILDEWIVRVLDETGKDLVAWPGAERESALYGVGGVGASLTTSESAPSLPLATEPRYESRVWPEVEAEIASGRRTALIGLGSIEQHGPHLPLGTDRWIADALLAGLEARLDDAIALPAIAVGCASEHLDFAGTLHVEPATLEALLRDVLCSLTHHGFERAFVFTAHGGNVDALADMTDRLTAAVAPLELRIGLDQRVGAMQSAVVEAESLPGASAGPHAGEYETSLVAGLRPGRVRVEALATGRIVERGESQGLFYPSLRPNAEEGVLGDPSSARGERGGRYLEGWLRLLEAGYRAAFAGSS